MSLPIIRSISSVSQALEAVPTYRTSHLMMRSAWSHEEWVVNRTLESVLLGQEKLLAFTKGVMGHELASWHRDGEVYIGLTADRLLIINPVAPNKGPIILWRELISSLKWESGPRQLTIFLGPESIKIKTATLRWSLRCEALLKIDNRLSIPVRKDTGNIDRTLIQAKTYHQLGFEDAGSQLLDKKEASAIWYMPGMLRRGASIREQRLALRTAAILLIIGGLFSLTLFFAGGGEGMIRYWLGASAGIDLLLGIQLWRGRNRPWSGIALYRAVLGPAVWLTSALATGYFWGFWLSLPFALTLLVLLVGRRSQAKTFLATAIFALGTLIAIFFG